MAFIFLSNSSYTVFLKASFSTTLFSLYEPTETVFNLPISNLSVSDLKLTKSAFLVNFDVSAPVAFF